MFSHVNTVNRFFCAKIVQVDECPSNVSLLINLKLALSRTMDIMGSNLLLWHAAWSTTYCMRVDGVEKLGLSPGIYDGFLYIY